MEGKEEGKGEGEGEGEQGHAAGAKTSRTDITTAEEQGDGQPDMVDVVVNPKEVRSLCSSGQAKGLKEGRHGQAGKNVTVSAGECLHQLVSGTNPQHYLVATQDVGLIKQMRKVRHARRCSGSH